MEHAPNRMGALGDFLAAAWLQGPDSVSADSYRMLTPRLNMALNRESA
jgi:hypothetical protein